MNSSAQAQKGFKTFILTLVISLVVFSAIYYIINSGNQSTIDSTRTADSNNVVITRSETPSADSATLGAKDTASETGIVDESPGVEESAFGDLAVQDTPEVQTRQVLQAAESGDTSDTTEVIDPSPPIGGGGETEEATVPETGISGPTAGLIMTLTIASVVAYIMFVGPRNLALSSFERRVVDELE